MSNNLTRVLVAAVAIPAAFAIVWYGGVLLAVLVAVLAVLGTRELFDLAGKAGVRPLRGLGMLLSALFPLATWLIAGEPFGVSLAGASWPGRILLGVPLWLLMQWPIAVALAPILVLMGVLWKRAPDQRPLAAAAVTIMGPLYCGLLPSALLVIRYSVGPDHSWPAVWVVFFPLAVTWLCDSFAMWGGKAFGGPKLAPAVSPGKTRSGGMSGLLGGAVTAVVYVPLALDPVSRGFPLWQAAIMGVVLASVAQLGDLAESLFKREAGVKDSGTLIPGHGGVLDRLDSLYFVLPTAVLLFRAFGVI